MSKPVGIFLTSVGDVIVLKHITDTEWTRTGVSLYIHMIDGNRSRQLTGDEANKFISDLISYHEIIENPEASKQIREHKVYVLKEAERGSPCCIRSETFYGCSCGIKKCQHCLKDHLLDLHRRA